MGVVAGISLYVIGAGNSGRSYSTLRPSTLEYESAHDVSIGHLQRLINCYNGIIIYYYCIKYY